MNALPEISSGIELENRFRSASSEKERLSCGEELLRCYTYTQPDKALALLEQWTRGGGTRMTAFLWKTRGVLANQRNDLAEATYAFKEALQAAEEEESPEMLAEVLLDHIALDLNRSSVADAEFHLDMAARAFRQQPRSRLSFRMLVRQAFLELHGHREAAALTFFLQAERLLPALQGQWTWEDLDHLALLHGGMGEVYAASGERDLARQSFQKALAISRQYGLANRLAWHLLQAGNAALALERWDEAESLYREVVACAMKGQEGARAGALANLGFLLLRKDDTEGAAAALDAAERTYREGQGDLRNLAVVETWKARLARQEGRKSDVMPHFIRATELAREVHDNRQLALICRDIAQYLASQDDHRNAFDYFQLYDELAERSREEVQQRRLMEIQVRYETEQKEQEARHLRSEAIELRLQAMRAQMNPHFLFNALNGIQSFIHSEEPDKASRFLAKFAGLVRKTLNMSNAELVTLEEEVAFIKDYLFINQKLRFDGRLEFEVTMDDDIEEDRLMVPPMMIQPFVENAIEHGFIKREKGHVWIHIAPDGEDRICCTVRDDGIGREAAIALRSLEPQRESHQSLGIGITMERLEMLNQSGHAGHALVVSDLTDERGEPAGTLVKLYFPVRLKGVE